MLILFWVVVALTLVLILRNARYALRQYVSDRNKLILSLYFIFLLGLGYMIIRITARVMNLVETATETDLTTAGPLHRPARITPAADNVGD